MLNEIDALLVLNNIPGLGAVKIRRLIEHLGSATAVLEASVLELCAVPGFGPRLSEMITQWENSERWKLDRELVHQQEVKLITESSQHYPEALRGIPDRPVLLYVKGCVEQLSKKAVALVGTRVAGHYGRHMAESLARGLAQAGVTVFSGLARGIDTAAHQGALERGSTIAVIGSGLSKLYPRENQCLAQQIAENGAVVSEFPMLTPPDRPNFPQRNRIVSGSSAATVVVEAKEKSGAMITAKKAIEQERPVFAVPGRVDSGTFSGNHALISKGQARLIQTAEDILNFLGWEQGSVASQEEGNENSTGLQGEEHALWLQLPREESSLEVLAQKVNLPVAKLNVLLTKLLLKKKVKKYPGNIYRRTDSMRSPTCFTTKESG